MKGVHWRDWCVPPYTKWTSQYANQLELSHTSKVNKTRKLLDGQLVTRALPQRHVGFSSTHRMTEWHVLCQLFYFSICTQINISQVRGRVEGLHFSAFHYLKWWLFGGVLMWGVSTPMWISMSQNYCSCGISTLCVALCRWYVNYILTLEFTAIVHLCNH